MPKLKKDLARKILKQAIRQREHDQIRESFPLRPEQMRSLFDFIDVKLSANECDNRLTYTIMFLTQQGLMADPIVQWLEDAGGYCDCEVLANAEEKFLLVFPNK